MWETMDTSSAQPGYSTRVAAYCNPLGDYSHAGGPPKGPAPTVKKGNGNHCLNTDICSSAADTLGGCAPRHPPPQLRAWW